MPTFSLTISGDTISAVSIVSLIRSDNGQTPAGVTLPISLSLVNGQWTGSFADASPPLYYAYSFTITYGDGSTSGPAPALLYPTGVVAGVYGDISDIQAEMGDYLTQIAADPDNEQISGIIGLHEQKAINFADAWINAELAKNYFVTPATVNLAMLKIIFGKLGAWQLYQVRGLNDDPKNRDPFQEKFDWAKDELEELMFLNRGGFTRVTGYADAPLGRNPSVDQDGRRIPPLPFGPYWDGYLWRFSP